MYHPGECHTVFQKNVTTQRMSNSQFIIVWFSIIKSNYWSNIIRFEQLFVLQNSWKFKARNTFRWMVKFPFPVYSTILVRIFKYQKDVFNSMFVRYFTFEVYKRIKITTMIKCHGRVVSTYATHSGGPQISAHRPGNLTDVFVVFFSPTRQILE
jgi:hypothetical protein